MHAAIDEAAKRAGRDPAEVERAVNVMSVDGDADQSADQLARIAVDLRFSTLIVGVRDEDPIGFVRRLGEEVAPRLRDRLA
jgi:alkanesulfonate monooxygenase SsuD/methylene tetrahydromethanopterin reductase-like flavin-dependent oxidoreductase (luciferase family)